MAIGRGRILPWFSAIALSAILAAPIAGQPRHARGSAVGSRAEDASTPGSKAKGWIPISEAFDQEGYLRAELFAPGGANVVELWLHPHQPGAPAPADCDFVSYTTHGGSGTSALEQQIESATAVYLGIIESVVPGFLTSGDAGSLLVVSRDKALRGPSASPGSEKLLVVYPYVNDASSAKYICRRELGYSLTPEVGQALILLVQRPDIRPGELLRPAAADVITVNRAGAVDFPSALRLPNDDSLRRIQSLEPWMRGVVARGRKPAADSRWKEFRQ